MKLEAGLVDEEKVSKLLEILRRLNAGEDPDAVREEAREILASMEPVALAIAEQKLIKEGLSPSDLRELCAVHLEVLRERLERALEGLSPDHPVAVLTKEHEVILSKLDELERITRELERSRPVSQALLAGLRDVAEHLLEAESHHEREEKALFPELEKRGVFGPPQVMKLEHIELRELKKELKKLAEAAPEMGREELREKLSAVAEPLVFKLRDHIFKEDHILYPTALRVIHEPEAWRAIKEKCDKIGYCCFTPHGK